MIFGPLVETWHDVSTWLTNVCSMVDDDPALIFLRRVVWILVFKSSDLIEFAKIVKLTLK